MSRSSNGSVSSRGSRESRSKMGESMGHGMDSKKNNEVYFNDNSNRFAG